MQPSKVCDVSGACSCPITHAGPDCRLSLVPSCILPDGSSLRPLFWVGTITTQRRSQRDTPIELSSLGALPCGCVRELLELTIPFRSKWALLPQALLCLAQNVTLRELLETGTASSNWRTMRTVFDAASHAYKFVLASQQPRQGELRRLVSQPLLPLSDCMDRCGLMGWCVGRGQSVSCRCFPEAVRTVHGGCAAVRYAELSAPRDQPERAAALKWQRWWSPAAKFVGRAADGSGALPLLEASTSVEFNFIRCPLNCSGRGVCDLQGFCQCEPNYWGLDCGITTRAPLRRPPTRRTPPAATGSATVGSEPAGSVGRPIAWRSPGRRTAVAPRIYVYDLPVILRTGPQLLVE